MFILHWTVTFNCMANWYQIVGSYILGFHVILLPFADDIRTLDVHEGPTASDEQVDKMKEIVHKLRFKYRCVVFYQSYIRCKCIFQSWIFSWFLLQVFCIYRSDAFENPVLQQHYRNLEALALDMLAPEPIEDLTSISCVLIVLNGSLLSFLSYYVLILFMLPQCPR